MENNNGISDIEFTIDVTDEDDKVTQETINIESVVIYTENADDIAPTHILLYQADGRKLTGAYAFGQGIIDRIIEVKGQGWYAKNIDHNGIYRITGADNLTAYERSHRYGDFADTKPEEDIPEDISDLFAEDEDDEFIDFAQYINEDENDEVTAEENTNEKDTDEDEDRKNHIPQHQKEDDGLDSETKKNILKGIVSVALVATMAIIGYHLVKKGIEKKNVPVSNTTTTEQTTEEEQQTFASILANSESEAQKDYFTKLYQRVKAFNAVEYRNPIFINEAIALDIAGGNISYEDIQEIFNGAYMTREEVESAFNRAMFKVVYALAMDEGKGSDLGITDFSNSEYYDEYLDLFKNYSDEKLESFYQKAISSIDQEEIEWEDLALLNAAYVAFGKLDGINAYNEKAQSSFTGYITSGVNAITSGDINNNYADADTLIDKWMAENADYFRRAKDVTNGLEDSAKKERFKECFGVENDKAWYDDTTIRPEETTETFVTSESSTTNNTTNSTTNSTTNNTINSTTQGQTVAPSTTSSYSTVPYTTEPSTTATEPYITTEQSTEPFITEQSSDPTTTTTEPFVSSEGNDNWWETGINAGVISPKIYVKR